MTKWSPRAWVMGGFSISLLSVILNTVVFSRLNVKLAQVNGELTSVKDSMARMASDIQRAESKYELVRVFHWVAMSLPKEKRDTARTEAAYILVNYLTRTYAAIHDIPVQEVVRTDMIEKEDDYAAMKKLSDLANALENADDKERERIGKEVDAIDENAVMIPKTELGKKFHELELIAYSEAGAENESDLLLSLAPTLQSLRTDFVKTYAAKDARLKELEAQRAVLSSRQSLTSYLAIAMQLLGLFFILSRDIVKDINESKKKAAPAPAPPPP